MRRMPSSWAKLFTSSFQITKDAPPQDAKRAPVAVPDRTSSGGCGRRWPRLNSAACGQDLEGGVPVASMAVFTPADKKLASQYLVRVLSETR